jgi:hypothetical protein
MSVKLERNAVILVKTEGTYGLDPTPTAADDALQSSKVSYKIVPNNRKRNAMMPQEGAAPDLKDADGVTLGFTVDISGSGTANVPARIGRLIKACKFTETPNVYDAIVTPFDAHLGAFPATGGSGQNGAIMKNDLFTISVAGTLGGVAVIQGDKIRALVNTPGQTAGNWAVPEISSGNVVYVRDTLVDCSSVTIYFYEDGILKKAHGCVGVTTFNFEGGKFATIQFEFTGLWGGLASITEPGFPTKSTIDFGDEPTPPVVKGANFLFDNITLAITKLELKAANKVIKRVDLNAANSGSVSRYSIADGEIEGSFDPEATELATFNPYDRAGTNDLADLSASLGSAAGNRVKVELTNCQIDWPDRGARDEISTYALKYTARPLYDGSAEKITITFS